MVGPFFKRKPYPSGLLPHCYSARVILRHYSFCDCTLARRFLHHDLEIYVEQVVTSRQTSALHERLPSGPRSSLPDHFARPSRTGSREWNHSKSDYDMRRAFKAAPIIPLPESPRPRFSDARARAKNEQENAIRQARAYCRSMSDSWRVSEIFIRGARARLRG